MVRLAAVPDSGPIRDGIYIRVSAVMGRKDDHFLGSRCDRAPSWRTHPPPTLPLSRSTKLRGLSCRSAS